MVMGILLVAVTVVTGAEDFVKLHPQYYKILLENEKVRVLEYRLKPGEEEGMHTHIRAGVIYFLKDATFDIISPDGTRKTVSVKAGDASWREPTSHAMKNSGGTVLLGVAVEVKD